nr:MAG TPA: hypothetical protein [Caudoviricetes sp.]
MRKPHRRKAHTQRWSETFTSLYTSKFLIN